MAKKEIYRYYGYFEGMFAKKIYDKHADEILSIINENPDEFHLQEGDIDTDINNPTLECMFGYEMSSNEDYLVRYERGNINDEEWLIDVYKRKIVDVVETPNTTYDSVYEYCPHCDNEVHLENEFKVQKCPGCGKFIVPCNICPLLAKGTCPSVCPLSSLAREMNFSTYGEESSIAQFVSLFNTSTEKQWIKGFIITNINKYDVIDSKLRVYYLKEYDTICFMDEGDSGYGWFMKNPKKLSVDYLNLVFEKLDICLDRLFVKVLD